MKMQLLTSILMVIFSLYYVYGGQSTITESEGYACLDEDRTKRQVEELSLKDAMRNAITRVSSYIESETHVKDFAVEKSIVKAYANGKVSVIEAKGKWDSNPPRIGDCYRIKIKAEVIPDEESLKLIPQYKEFESPTAPLRVKVWTEKLEYKAGDTIKLFLKGNRPFYARIIYQQADGNIVQILPNPRRKDNYFQGGMIYEIPSGPDKFVLEVVPPFGKESFIVYASTAALGDINLEKHGTVYKVATTLEEVGGKTRGVRITEKESKKAAQFVEEKITILTQQ